MSIHNGEKGEVIIFYLEITTELKTIPKKQMATEVNRLWHASILFLKHLYLHYVPCRILTTIKNNGQTSLG